MRQLRPSKSHIWHQCWAAPRFIEALPEQSPGDPAREGTCAAWVAECVLKDEVDHASQMIGKSHKNGWLVENDMAEHIQGYVDHLRSRGLPVYVEEEMSLNDVIGGTPDAFMVDYERGILYVDDLKYGYDIVDPYENPQLSIYAGAIWRVLGRTFSQEATARINHVVIGVYQPRAFHPEGPYRTWEPSIARFLAFVKQIEASGNQAQKEDSVATPGRHCKHCEAAATCVALAHSTYRGFDVVRDNRQATLDADALSRELKVLDQASRLIETRASAIRAEAKARMERGEYIPGWVLKPRYGNRKITVDPWIVKAMTGVDAYAEPKICTPAELVRRGVPKETVDRMSTRPRIPSSLSPVDLGETERLFNKGKNS